MDLNCYMLRLLSLTKYVCTFVCPLWNDSTLFSKGQRPSVSDSGLCLQNMAKLECYNHNYVSIRVYHLKIRMSLLYLQTAMVVEAALLNHHVS